MAKHRMVLKRKRGESSRWVKCDGRLKVRWAGMRCDCGARWFCY